MVSDRPTRLILDPDAKSPKPKRVVRDSGGGVWEIGANYLIRTVTMIDTGRLVKVTEHELVLEDAAWVADTARFADALISCEFNEVEPFPAGQVILGRGAIVDAVKINKLPREQK